jgi:DNA adenine methylase
MHYLGGKFRSKKQICEYLKEVIEKNDIKEYIEPFCGSLWITSELAKHDLDINYTVSDSHKALIAMWKELQQGWIPDFPDDLTELEKIYDNLKLTKHTESTPMHGFIGFACSFSGKYFGGFARSRGRNHGQESWNSIRKNKLPHLSNFNFDCCDYTKYNGVKGALIYCDPPYAKTTKYSSDFDSSKFWDWVREMSKDNIVLVSECQAPDDFQSVLDINVKRCVRSGKDNGVVNVVTEGLYQAILP